MSDGKFSYEAEWTYYSRRWPTRPIEYKRLLPYLECWLDARTLFRGRRILDIGAGECAYTRLIADYKPSLVVACELFRERMLPTIRTGSSDRIRFIAGDCLRLPIRSRSVDIVFGSLVLHQIPNLADVVAEVRRVLRPGGRYVGIEPRPYHPLHLYRYLFSARSANQYLLSPADLGIFRRAGFDVRVRYFWGRMPKIRSRIIATCFGIEARLGCMAGGGGS